MAEGATTPNRMEKVEEEINEELRLWQRNGMNPQGIQPDLFSLSVKVQMIIEILKELPQFPDQKELNIKFKETYLNELKELRQDILAQRARQSIIVPNNGIIL